MGWLGTFELSERQMIRLTKQDRADLRRFAKAEGRSPGAVMRALLAVWLDQRRAPKTPATITKENINEQANNRLVPVCTGDHGPRADDEPWK